MNQSAQVPKMKAVISTPFNSDQCVTCHYRFYTIKEHYGCGQCKTGPFCINCLFNKHGCCTDTFFIFEEINRFLPTVTEWMRNPVGIKYSNALKGRCKRRQLISEIEKLLENLDPVLVKCIKKRYMEKALEIEELLDEIPKLSQEFHHLALDLNEYINQTPPPYFTIQHIKQAKEIFSRLSEKSRLLNETTGGQNGHLLEARNLLRSMSTNQTVRTQSNPIDPPPARERRLSAVAPGVLSANTTVSQPNRARSLSESA